MIVVLAGGRARLLHQLLDRERNPGVEVNNLRNPTPPPLLSHLRNNIEAIKYMSLKNVVSFGQLIQKVDEAAVGLVKREGVVTEVVNKFDRLPVGYFNPANLLIPDLHDVYAEGNQNRSRLGRFNLSAPDALIPGHIRLLIGGVEARQRRCEGEACFGLETPPLGHGLEPGLCLEQRSGSLRFLAGKEGPVAAEVAQAHAALRRCGGVRGACNGLTDFGSGLRGSRRRGGNQNSFEPEMIVAVGAVAAARVLTSNLLMSLSRESTRATNEIHGGIS